MTLLSGILNASNNEAIQPDDVSGLVLWLDASDTDTLTGDPVTAWADKSASGLTADDSAGGLEPTRNASAQNSLNGLEYDGINTSNGEVLIVDDAAAIQNIFNGGGYITLAVKPLASGGADVGTLIAKGMSVSDGFLFMYTNTSGSDASVQLIKHFSGTDGVWRTTARPITFNNAYVIDLAYNDGSAGNDPLITVNGALAAVTETATPTGTSESDATRALSIGGREDGSTARSMDGYMLEILVYNRIPTALERVNIREYLTTKWGI